jgi:hypothetical protein
MHKEMKKVYISGPMTGLPNLNYPAFHKRATELREKGFWVANPAEHFDGQQDIDRKVCLRTDLKALLDCDYVTFLDGFETSAGALLEAYVARECGVGVLDKFGEVEPICEPV